MLKIHINQAIALRHQSNYLLAFYVRDSGIDVKLSMKVTGHKYTVCIKIKPDMPIKWKTPHSPHHGDTLILPLRLS